MNGPMSVILIPFKFQYFASIQNLSEHQFLFLNLQKPFQLESVKEPEEHVFFLKFHD
jgi:hypothetical protein